MVRSKLQASECSAASVEPHVPSERVLLGALASRGSGALGFGSAPSCAVAAAPCFRETLNVRHSALRAPAPAISGRFMQDVELDGV